MLARSLFFVVVAAAIQLAVGHPAAAPESSSDANLYRRKLGDKIVESYHPPNSFETFGDGIEHPLGKRAKFSLSDAAVAFAGARAPFAGRPRSKVSFRKGFSNDVAQHAFLTQFHNGIPFANAVANVVFNRKNKVVSYGSSFVTPDNVASSTPSLGSTSAISIAEKFLDGKYNGHPVSLEYYATANNTALLTYVVQVQNDDSGLWVEAFVDAHAGEVVSVNDFVAHATYLALPVNKQSLTDGGQQVLTNPEDLLASPQGWHSNGVTTYTTTMGNNAFAFKGTSASLTSQSSSGPTFNYVQDPTQAPTVAVNVDAARVNTFYIANTIHDFTYRYGFTESAFNFQNNNFGLGGAGNDSVSISVQDSAGTNNADFTTPPDGQSGRMRMFIWTFTTPNRDGALQNDIVTHEYTHGVTSRMTGGGTARCLLTLESLGLGEGWSDAMANWAEKTSAAVPDYVLAPYVSNNPAGYRSYPYSTSMTTNPLTYQDLQTRVLPHDKGEIWANMLHNVYAALVAAYGWSATARTNPSGTQGNIVFLHLFIDALTIQPCSPKFTNARDAWIQADANRYASANYCLLWRAFASRGLGVGAANSVNSFAIPSTC